MYRCSERRTVSPCLSCLPVQVMTYGCDFPHPYTFPLVSGVPQSEGHSSITPSVPNVLSKWIISCKSGKTRAENEETKPIFFWVQETINSSELQRGIVWKNEATTSRGIQVSSSTAHLGQNAEHGKSPPAKTESTETCSDGPKRKLLYLQPLL